LLARFFVLCQAVFLILTKATDLRCAECIHPSQVEIVQRVFGPDEAEVEWAVRLLIANEKASAAGRGAWTLDGKMIDAPVVGKARMIVDKAEKCGLHVHGIRQKWRHQEPE
jgi:citrate lyase subunit beta-like protein